jgi:hypothetical protein
MILQAGDVIEFPDDRHLAGVWVTKRVVGAVGFFIRAAGGDRTLIDRSVHQATLLARPTFAPGERIAYRWRGNEQATVIADEGDTVRIAFDLREFLTRDQCQQINTHWSVPAERAELVAQNLSRWIAP